MFRRYKFYPYAIQLGDNKEVLYLNYALSVKKAFKKFLLRHPQIRNSKLRTDLIAKDLYFASTKQADRGCRHLIRQLEELGYEIIAGGPVKNNFYKVYVIEINGDPQHLYVGQTNYPVEKRFQQHVCKCNPSRALLKYDNLELAMQHADHLPSFLTQTKSLEAEATLAEELRAKGFRVEGGH